MPRGSEARAWWADVEDVRERIEHRRADERMAALARRGAESSAQLPAQPRPRRTVSITGRPEPVAAPALRLVQEAAAAPAKDPRARRRPRPRAVDRVGTRPDRIAAWAVLLGVLLVLVAVLSAHS